MRGTFKFAVEQFGTPVTWLYFAGDEASEDQMAGADAGRPAPELAELHYTSPGRAGQDWRVYGLDPTFARLDGSLVSDTGPWTDLAAGLGDAAEAGTERTLWVRLVVFRWEGGPDDDANPRLGAVLSFGTTRPALIEDPPPPVPTPQEFSTWVLGQLL